MRLFHLVLASGRQRIEQLQGYREHGITTLAEGVEFDLAVKRRSDEVRK